MKYSGAEWIEKSLGKEMSQLGKDVADLLGDVFMGIYHLDTKALKRVDWDNSQWIEYIHFGDLATVDSSVLTILVVLAHDRMIRVSIQGVGPHRMKMLFHQRKERTESTMSRYPEMEDHTREIRKHYDEDYEEVP